MLELRGVTKRYAGAEVLTEADLAARPGEVHAVVGENGAGKSTMLRIAAGLVRPDAGSVRVAGRPLAVGNPRAALHAGVALVSQELAWVPARSVLENVYLGSRRAPVGRLTGRRRLREEFAELCHRTGIDLPPDAPARALSQAQHQQLEVLRAFAHDPAVLVCDEPTAALGGAAARRLLTLLRRSADAGMAVVFVSHLLEEVLAVADNVTVLRDGHVVASAPAAELSERTLVQHMVGREVRLLYPELPAVRSGAAAVLTVSGLRAGTAVRGVSLRVDRGEIVGLAGLIGSGRTEFARAVLGADHVEAGTISVDGGPAVRPTSVRRTLAAGVALVPEDRKAQGLFLQRSTADNLALGSLRSFTRYGVVARRRIRVAANRWVRRADVRPADPAVTVNALSGGNQQKVLLARWLARRPPVLIADEPTRGVDINAKSHIHRLLADAARGGMGVVLISSELEEVLGMSHRVVVFRHGRIAGEFPAGHANREAVLAAAFGVEGETGATVGGSPAEADGVPGSTGRGETR